MNNDEQIRRVIVASLPDVDDEQGWAGVQARIGPARRRRRLMQSAAAVTVGAVLVGLGIGTRAWLTDSPDVAETNDTTTTSTTIGTATECLSPLITDDDIAYLERWTAGGTSLRADRCVLAGVTGPEPDVTPEGLGVEMPLHPDRLSDDVVLPHSALMPPVDYYPIVHLGQVDVTDTHGYLYWVSGASSGPVPNIGGATGSPGDTMATQTGIWAVDTSYPTITVYVIVPAEASIAALEMDNIPVAWQRPVAKAAVFVIDETQLESSPSRITVTIYDQSGATIDRYEGNLD